jgi:ligand-binding SRPBCC domain-containing protein
MPLIRLETSLHAPVERCFDLSRSVDLHRDSVAHTHERAVAGITTGLLELGDTVTWEAVHFGIKQRLTVKITEFERPSRFTDEMIQGAFQELKHVHEFLPQADGTLMIDRFLFRSPLGPLGWLADTLVLTRYLRGFLRTRNSYIKHLAEANRDTLFP